MTIEVFTSVMLRSVCFGMWYHVVILKHQHVHKLHGAIHQEWPKHQGTVSKVQCPTQQYSRLWCMLCAITEL